MQDFECKKVESTGASQSFSVNEKLQRVYEAPEPSNVDNECKRNSIDKDDVKFKRLSKQAFSALVTLSKNFIRYSDSELLQPTRYSDPELLQPTNSESKSQTHFKFYCSRCCQQSSYVSIQTYQDSAYAWAFLFLVSAGILWSWLPFAMRDFRQTTVCCTRCRSILRIYKQKISAASEKLFLFLLTVDFLTLISFALCNLIARN